MFDTLNKINKLPKQSVPITTAVVSWSLDQYECTTLCDKVYQWLATCWWFSSGPLVASTNKYNLLNITKIFLKVARTHHYRLRNHSNIEAEHKEVSLLIITPCIIIIILVGFMPLSKISSLYLGGYIYWWMQPEDPKKTTNMSSFSMSRKMY
jgi:hypothetical protein